MGGRLFEDFPAVPRQPLFDTTKLQVVAMDNMMYGNRLEVPTPDSPGRKIYKEIKKPYNDTKRYEKRYILAVSIKN